MNLNVEITEEDKAKLVDMIRKHGIDFVMQMAGEKLRNSASEGMSKEQLNYLSDVALLETIKELDNEPRFHQ